MAAHSCSGVLLALNLVLTNDPLGSRNDVKSTDTIISSILKDCRPKHLLLSKTSQNSKHEGCEHTTVEHGQAWLMVATKLSIHKHDHDKALAEGQHTLPSFKYAKSSDKMQKD